MKHTMTQQPDYFVADFNNEVVSLGPISIKWYGLAYVVGIFLAWLYSRYYLKRQEKPVISLDQLDALVVWLVMGVLIGGRLGYVLFYKPMQYLEKPWELFFVWQGGMAFHGALLGVGAAVFLFARKHHIKFWRLTDMLSCATPLGLFLGRIANFINAELWGRPTDVPWAVIFPHVPYPRHPSQLYEALTEGILLFLLLSWAFWWRRWDKAAGKLTGLFLTGYSLCRFGVEFYREPDAHIGYLWFSLSMGQWLTLPIFILGIYLFVSRKARHGTAA